MIINLNTPIFKYDDVANRLIITLTEAPPDSSTDPANYEPQWTYTVEVPLPRDSTKKQPRASQTVEQETGGDTHEAS